MLLDNLIKEQEPEDTTGKLLKTPYEKVPRPEILDKVYENVVNVAVGSVQMAYDADCVFMAKPAIAEEQKIYKKVPKILWADKKINFTTARQDRLFKNQED